VSWLILFFYLLDANLDAGPFYLPSLPNLTVLSAAVASAPSFKWIIKVSEPLEAPLACSTCSYRAKVPKPAPSRLLLPLPLAIEATPSPGIITSKVVCHAPTIYIPP